MGLRTLENGSEAIIYSSVTGEPLTRVLHASNYAENYDLSYRDLADVIDLFVSDRSITHRVSASQIERVWLKFCAEYREPEYCADCGDPAPCQDVRGIVPHTNKPGVLCEYCFEYNRSTTFIIGDMRNGTTRIIKGGK